jgi:polysaccharide pyruvyl transferase WcaK-like protein
MFESFVQNVPGRILAVTGPRATYRVPGGQDSRVKLLSLPALVYGFGPNHVRALKRFAQLVARARSVSIVGADIMDGGYGVRRSVTEWVLAQAASAAGKPTRVLGFSWQSDTADIVAEAARRAVDEGVVALLRDPDSADRFEAATGVGANRAADIVFCLDAADSEGVSHPAVEQAAAMAARAPLLVVNVSALIARRIDLADDYVRVVQAARAAGFEVLFVPHVGDASGGDRAAIEDVVARLGWGAPQVQELLPPLQIKALAAHASVVLTGRMHLAILALSAGTPAIVLSTQGKVAGLMREVGAPDWCVEPRPGFSDQVIPIIEARRDGGPAADVARGVEQLKVKAGLNFDGLQDSDHPKR